MMINRIILALLLFGQPKLSFLTAAFVDTVVPSSQDAEFVFRPKIGWVIDDKLELELLIIGQGFAANSQDQTSSNRSQQMFLSFTSSNTSCGIDRIPYVYRLISISDREAKAKVTLPRKRSSFYPCLKSIGHNHSSTSWIHQGSQPNKVLVLKLGIFPKWVISCAIPLFVVMSAIFSGLNLGLMSLTIQDLDIIISSNEDPETVKYAKRIKPIRENGNLLLCTILFGNVLVNACLTTMIDSFQGSVTTVLISTSLIVVFGEIIPQAFCSKNALYAGSLTVGLMKVIIVMLYPIAKPMSMILDKVIGVDAGIGFTQAQIFELIKRKDTLLGDTERSMLSGMLASIKLPVGEIMTPLKQVFMLDQDRTIDNQLYTEIYVNGFTRIPVFSGNRENITGVLHIRDFAFIDPENSKIKVANLAKINRHQIGKISYESTIVSAFESFKKGKYFIAVVHKQSPKTNGGDQFVPVGIVTPEDVAEEIFQSKINDEFNAISHFSDSKLNRNRRINDYSVFLGPSSIIDNIVSPHSRKTVFKILSTLIEPFTDKYISPHILRKLICNPQFFVQYRPPERVSDDDCEGESADLGEYIYESGKLMNFFIIITEGYAKVESGDNGSESSVMTAFSCFGSCILNNLDGIFSHEMTTNSQWPSTEIRSSFSLRPIGPLTYLKVTRLVWLAAVRTSMLESRPNGQYSPSSQSWRDDEDSSDNQSINEQTNNFSNGTVLQKVTETHSSISDDDDDEDSVDESTKFRVK